MSNEQRPNRKQSVHPTRKPIGTRNKLTADAREGYVRRWVNDVNGRVSMFEEAGYEAVRIPTQVGEGASADATQLGSVVRKPVGGGVDAVLMEIPKEWSEEDMARKESALKLKEQSLLSEAKEGFYGKGVDIEHSRPKVTID